MEVTGTSVVGVTEPGAVAAARRAAVELASGLGLDEAAVGRVALAVTEAGTNLLKHAGGGSIVLRAVPDRAAPFVDILGLDRGPGMASVGRCLEDGYSTAGSPGTGLGALRRLSSQFDVYSGAQGTAVLARVGPSAPGAAPRAPAVHVEGLSLPRRGEQVCGDAFEVEHRPRGVAVLVADGLGHGPVAAAAAAAAVTAFGQTRGGKPGSRLEVVHQALRPTRGAAVAIADLDLDTGVVRFAGLGNVAAVLHDGAAARHLVSQPGTAGHVARRIEEYTYPWRRGDLLVAHSDGLSARLDLSGYPGLTRRHPALIAGVLYRDAGRELDDATVVVARAA
jgi:anti-sigma regulatory factor (Ser/Thr protein kinase)